MRIVVTGRQGQVVSALLERGPAAGVDIVALGRPDLDLADAASIRAAVSAARPDAIVSAAAYTAVDKAESEPDLAFAVNAEGPAALAAVAAELDVPIVHLSTDYVFSGEKTDPYVESDPTGPVSVYGRSKLEGERRIAQAQPNHAILRTAWVYSPFGANFLKTMLRLGETRDAVNVVADQHGTPTSALDIADAVIAVARRLAADPDPNLRGTFHLTGSGEATWADFAETIFAEREARTGKRVTVGRIGTADYPTPARRPANSRLSGEKLGRVYGLVLPDWRVSTKAVLDRLL
ncbi:dTDP-4-dehydrorhamnose reductase [Aureimonas phyllosphaerae]|uniref:dTDP-4-dehydrorhamnose reductase n=1 Tax=Aureimonas phyllosphaerae TaxID=1166078 RepID=A0A7W6FV34_9HYPH|nr:dTDP-4-dehydrorhamnose reductase [Aureimonas phyllosphaerae]MBB3936753.1 dTDP-4-dehydrorhamnose reductase [Aureimonas phyllosphaerae]MBB3960384.1 dTDP-4-dehydrorhamnose reductase [Aureimonas phyllosphaerae]SFF22305.1 dTDP-4-dehydrorhamnose reductase [Aureimonas phyllosphaerae]